MSRDSLDRAMAVGTPHLDAIAPAVMAFAVALRDALDRPGVSWKFAAPEAERLTIPAEYCAPSGVPMSGGAEPAGAAKYPADKECEW